MVQIVHAFIHEAGDHQRDAGHEVPAQAITRHRIILHVGDFVDEAAETIQGQHGDYRQRGGGGHRQTISQDQRRQRTPTQRGAGQRVDPVDGRLVHAQLAAQRGGQLDHRHVFTGHRPGVFTRAGGGFGKTGGSCSHHGIAYRRGLRPDKGRKRARPFRELPQLGRGRPLTPLAIGESPSPARGEGNGLKSCGSPPAS